MFSVNKMSRIKTVDKVYNYEVCCRIIENIKSNIIEKLNYKTGVIIIHLRRSEYCIFVMIAILQLGLTFVPLDINMPQNRLNNIINGIKHDLVISDKHIQDKKFIHISTLLIKKNRNDLIFKNDIAYIIFTSGSTGIPKGVRISYTALSSFISSFTTALNLQSCLSIASITNIAFDIFIVESILPMIIGMTIVFIGEDYVNPKKILKIIYNSEVDVLQLTPSRLQLFLEIDPSLSFLSKVKDLLIGGERLTEDLLNRVNELLDIRIHNLYGPTEATVWVTHADLTDSKHVHLGKPLSNVSISIIKDCKLQNRGSIGEIGISGMQLFSGYTNETRNSCITIKKERYYLTGDIGYIADDGNLYFIGRKDNQIKLNGNRIELEEIEFHLNSYSKIKQSIVKYHNGLEAYYTSDYELSGKELIDYLSSHLPNYMIPGRYYRVDKFLMTPNMKIDRKANHTKI